MWKRWSSKRFRQQGGKENGSDHERHLRSFPDVQRPRYAEEHAEEKVERMLMEVLKEG
jgi:hypothetical protein